MLTDKYKPKTIESFIGNKQVIQPIIKWLLEWDFSNKKNKCLLLSGICGIGKNLLVELIVKKHDYNIVSLGVDEERNRDYINTFIKPLLNTKKTFDGQDNILVVSDIDNGSDYGFISTLTECIKETKIPIICICNNRYDQSIKPIINYCLDIKMLKPTYNEIYSLLYNVVVNEKIKIKEPQIRELYELSNGDIRFILNSLQLNFNKTNINAISKNIQNINIFETTGRLFSMDEIIERKNEIYWYASDIHTLMVQENYINNIIGLKDDISKLEKLSYSADALSDADLFNTNDCDWTLTSYIAMNTIRATSKCNKKTMIKFPQYLGRISTQNKNKREKLNYEYVKFFKNEEKPKSKSIDKKKEIKNKIPKKAKK